MDGILYNSEVLDDAFPPTRLLHRDGQLSDIRSCLSPALKSKSISNIYIWGPPGTGKTVLMRFILENYFQEKSVYVNCFRFRTSREILKEILFKFNQEVRETDNPSDLFKKLSNMKKIIVCLDEVDLIKESDKDEVLYNITDLGCGIITISNYPVYHLFNLDARTRDRLKLHEIEFAKYTADQLFDIGKDRREYAFVPGSLSDSMIKVAAQKADGDARSLLFTLKTAGRLAERKGTSKIEIEDVMEGIKEAKKLKKSYLLRKLNDEQKIIYGILESNDNMYSGELFREFLKSVRKKVTQRMFRNHMKKISNLGLVDATGGEGRYRKYEIVV